MDSLLESAEAVDKKEAEAKITASIMAAARTNKFPFLKNLRFKTATSLSKDWFGSDIRCESLKSRYSRDEPRAHPGKVWIKDLYSG